MRADATDVVLNQLSGQEKWYSDAAQINKWVFQSLKAVQIVGAASIPVAAVAKSPTWVTAVLGSLIVVLEGFQQLGQFQPLWITYRSTAEELRHERFLYEAHAGPYATSSEPSQLLAERMEALIQQEHARWASAQDAAAKGPAQATTP